MQGRHVRAATEFMTMSVHFDMFPIHYTYLARVNILRSIFAPTSCSRA